MHDVTGSNPFATRFTRPGALEYRWPGGDSLEACLQRLRASHWRSEIVGAHGSGKSTLLATLLPAMAAAGKRTVVFELQPGQRGVVGRSPRWNWLDKRAVVVVDGYEQLSRLARWSLLRMCRWSGSGLIVTSHTPVGLPTLLATHVEPELAVSLTRELLDADASITEQEVRDALAAHGGNLREAFFALYDLYELRRRREV